MAHKVHPKIFRIKETKDWLSRGFYKDLPKELEEDFKIREFFSKFQREKNAGIEKVEIERFPAKINIVVFSSKPGVIIGKGGEGVEEIRKKLLKKVFKINLGEINKKNKESNFIKNINLEVREVRNPWLSASLCAQWVAQQIEKRANYRKTMKQAISKVMSTKEVKGVRVEVSGRLNGVEIARREWLAEGKLPRQTIRADIDYAFTEAYCTYGVIGVKVWIYKGEKFD